MRKSFGGLSLACCLLLAVGASQVNAAPIEAAGGGYPAPGGNNFSSVGSLGGGGATGTYTSFDPTAYSALYWGPALIDMGITGDVSPLFFASGFGTPTAVWDGPMAAFGGQTGQFTATLSSGNWILASSLGIVGGPDVVAQITGSPFIVTESFTVGFQTFDNYFNGIPFKSPGERNQMDFTGEFWYNPPVNGDQGVPGPIAGAGLPGLLLASGGLLGWWRRRKKEGAAGLAAG